MIDLHGTGVKAVRSRIARRRLPAYWWVWGCGALAILGVLAANSLIVSQFRRAALDDTRSEVARLAAVDAAATDRVMRQVDVAVSALAARLAPDAASDAGFRGAVTRFAPAAALKATLAPLPQLAALGVIGADGRLLAWSGNAPPAAIAGGNGLAVLGRDPQRQPFIGAPTRNPHTGSWSILWARPVTADDGAVAGAVVAAVRLGYFEDFFAAGGLGGEGATALRRSDGSLIARTPPMAGAASLAAERQGFAALGGTGEPRFGHIAAGSGLVPAIVVRRNLPGYPLAVTVAMTERAVLARWHREAWTVTAGAIARVIAILLIAALVRRHLIARDQVAAARVTIDADAAARAALQQAVARSESAICEHERAATALRESEQRFRDVAEVAADVIWETGPDHRFMFFTGGSAEEIRNQIGIDVAQVIGKTRWELGGGDPETDEGWRNHKADLDAHRPFRQFRYAIVSHTGNRVHYMVNGKPMFDTSGRFLGYRGIATNETKIIEARSRAERAEMFLHDAVDSISEGFVIYDEDDRLALCNEAFLNLYPTNREMLVPGSRFEDILRDGLRQGLYADAIGREEEWLARRMESHRNPRGPIEARHSNGRWLLICERPMRGGGIAGLRIDITAMKAAQAALYDSEERLNRAQSLARMGCDSRDLRTERREWSDETYRIFGLSRENFTPTTEGLFALVHPDDHAIILKCRADTEMGKGPVQAEFRIIRPDNTIRYVARESELVRDANGTPIMVAGTIRDITDLRASQARQKELERQLQHSQKMKALGTLAGGIAHDLNNTLVPMLSLSKLVAERMPPDSVDREDLETIIFASERARDLLQQILLFSRNQVSLKEEVDLAVLTRKSLQMLRVTAPPTVRLVEEIAPVAPTLGDAGQLQRVIVNLVTNSIQAIGKHEGTVTVTVAAAPPGVSAQEGEPDRPTIMLSVADTGCGMDAATVERMFEPFYTTKRVGEGTGLGLSVVHGIVTDHGGRIEVESQRRKGTVFRILLPASNGAGAPQKKTKTAMPDDGVAAVVPQRRRERSCRASLVHQA